MKRYLLFAGAGYYAAGGMADYKGDFDTVEGAKQLYEGHEERRDLDWFEIVEHATMTIVEQAGYSYCDNDRDKPVDK